MVPPISPKNPATRNNVLSDTLRFLCLAHCLSYRISRKDAMLIIMVTAIRANKTVFIMRLAFFDFPCFVDRGGWRVSHTRKELYHSRRRRDSFFTVCRPRVYRERNSPIPALSNTSCISSFHCSASQFAASISLWKMALLISSVFCENSGCH